MQTRIIRVNGRDSIVKLAGIIGFGVFIAQMLELDALVSVLFACSIVCVIANYLSLISARNRLRLDDLLLFLLTLLCILFSDWKLNFDYFKPAIIVLCSILCIDRCTDVTADERTRRYIYFGLLLVCAVTNYLYYFEGLRSVYYGSTDLVSFNVGNPNETAMWLIFLIVLLCDSMQVSKGISKKLLSLMCTVSLMPMLYSTQSRNCFLATLFFFAGKLCLRIFRIKKLPKWFLFLITISPILVYVGYVHIFLPHYDRFSKWFAFLVSEGKPLTARSRIWSDLEMNHLKNILFGNYAVYHTEQLHNSMVTLYGRFGVFYVVLVCRKLFRVLKRMPNAGMQLALSTVWLTGCFETSIFAGIAGMYMLVLLLPIFHQLDVNQKVLQ